MTSFIQDLEPDVLKRSGSQLKKNEMEHFETNPLVRYLKMNFRSLGSVFFHYCVVNVNKIHKRDCSNLIIDGRPTEFTKKQRCWVPHQLGIM